MMDYRSMDYSLIEEKIRRWGTFKLSKHAKERIRERNYSILDITYALAEPSVIRHECHYENGKLQLKYTVQGEGANGPFGVVVGIGPKGGVLVITIMDFDNTWELGQDGFFLKVS